MGVLLFAKSFLQKEEAAYLPGLYKCVFRKWAVTTNAEESRPLPTILSCKLIPIHVGASGHFLGKIALVFSLAEGLHGGVEIIVRLAVGGGAGGEVGAQLVRRAVAVGVLADDGGLGKAGWLGAALLLLGRAAKHQHTGGHNVLRQAQGLAHGLGVFNHVPDIAAADAQALGGGHGA